MKSSSFSRTLALAKLAAQVGLKEVASGGIKSRVDQARMIAQSLSNLKGAAMKAGQLLSLDLQDYFPPEAIEILSQLQSAAVAHPIEEIEQILSQELSPENFNKISKFESKPIGVASIGQVHKAVYQDEDIVLKIQYPGVSESIDSDLKILKSLAVMFCNMTRRRMNLDPLFEEFKTILSQEVDYSIEAQLQKNYLHKVSLLKNSQSVNYRVPKIIDELSTKKVLAMTFEQGLNLRAWMSSEPSKLQKHELGIAVLDLYFHEFFDWGMVQTDPNLGNFLIDDQNKELSLCLIDFGATKTYPKRFIRDYIQLLNLSVQNDHVKLKDHAIQFGLIDSRESEKAFQAFSEMLIIATRPFFIKKSGHKFFNFGDRTHATRSHDASKKLAQELVFSPPPHSIMFLHRKLAGVYAILKSLEVELDVSPYWQLMNDLAQEGSG